MKNIKQQFNDFRSTTPKHIQWLLLIAAFVVVIILLTLLLTHNKSKNDETVAKSNITTDLQYAPIKLKFDNIMVGETDEQQIDVEANNNIVINNVKIPESDFNITNDCDGQLTKSCTIWVEYAPTHATNNQTTNLTITWNIIGGESDAPFTKTIPITHSAQKKPEPEPEPKPEPKPEPVVIPEPEPEPEPIEIIEEEEYDEPIDTLDDIVVENPFVEPEPEPTPILPPEKCSEFAIPGYDTSGRQIGWIKPERGANYFHPFSDKDCSNPTGKYDMNTGIITSLKDGKKIGTDSDHIGYRNVRDRNLKIPQLSAPNAPVSDVAQLNGDGTFGENAVWVADAEHDDTRKFDRSKKSSKWDEPEYMTSNAEHVISTKPHDRTFILRQFKPIPATIVSEVRADPSVYGCNKSGQDCKPEKNYSIPVRATVDRNVYSDDGRTIILPTGTLLMGYLAGELPGPYQSFGRMNIRWYQFIRPDGIEFNFKDDDNDPYSGDAQGRMGVPGHGSTDYVEQMVMPIITALVPAAVNMIAPITDTVINQIDLDNNTVVQSGTIRSSEMAKQDIINTWNKITQKLIVDSIDNTVPPFSIAAGTRINVFSPVDLVVSCGDEDSGQKCSFGYGDKSPRKWSDLKKVEFAESTDPSWRGQVRSFNLNEYCDFDTKKNKVTIKEGSAWAESGYDYRTVLAYCESQNYTAINNAKNAAYNKQIQAQSAAKKEEYGAQWTQEDGWTTNFTDADAEKKYNTEVLGLTYDEDGNIENPFTTSKNAQIVDEGLTCEDGSAPDANGCCAGETFTDMGEDGWNCCPDAGGDCFPPIPIE